MRIYCAQSGREAKPIKGKNDAKPVYKCFPSGGKKNRDENTVKFERATEAADWLRRTPGGGIGVASIGLERGRRTAILNRTLVIEHDDGRMEKL